MYLQLNGEKLLNVGEQTAAGLKKTDENILAKMFQYTYILLFEMITQTRILTSTVDVVGIRYNDKFSLPCVYAQVKESAVVGLSLWALWLQAWQTFFDFQTL